MQSEIQMQSEALKNQEQQMASLKEELNNKNVMNEKFQNDLQKTKQSYEQTILQNNQKVEDVKLEFQTQIEDLQKVMDFKDISLNKQLEENQKLVEEEASLQKQIERLLIDLKKDENQDLISQLEKEFNTKIQQLILENKESDKLQQNQIRILQKKVSEFEEKLNQQIKEKEKRRNSKINSDQTEMINHREQKIQELSKNLVETKQSYDLLLEKANQINEKYKQVKEKLAKVNNPIQDEEEKKTDEEKNPFIWDLQIVNETKTLSSITDKGWIFSKSSAEPIKPYKQLLLFFSLESSDIYKSILYVFNKNISQLKDQIAYIKVHESMLFMAKLLNSENIPQSLFSNITDNQLWDEIWLEFAVRLSSTVIFCLTELTENELITLKNLTALKVPQLIILLNHSPQQEVIARYLSHFFNLKANDNIFLIKIDEINRSENFSNFNSIIQKKEIEEKVFLDQVKNFMTKDIGRFLMTGKPQVKIAKLPAPNTFQYLVKTDSKKLNLQRIAMIQNMNLPYFQVWQETNKIIVKLEFKGLTLINGSCDILQDQEMSYLKIKLKYFLNESQEINFEHQYQCSLQRNVTKINEEKINQNTYSVEFSSNY